MILPTELLCEVFQWCDIDTKLKFRRAATKIRFKDSKISRTIEVEPIVGYYTIPLTGGPHDVFDARKPWVMATPENDWWELIWGRYRVIRGYCERCGSDEYSTFTCNKSDYTRSGYLISHERTSLPPRHANNWLGRVCLGCK